MLCPLCGTRRARRGCPAVGQQICAVCCGTKRLVEINCPKDCPYLASAREHPAAATIRQERRDVDILLPHLRDLSERQSQLFFLISTFLLRYEPPEFHKLVDADVADAAAALAGTFETAARGVIYEHRPAALPAERLAAALKSVVAEAGQHGGSAFERDAAVVLRRIEEAARAAGGPDPADDSTRRAYLDLLGRVLRDQPDSAGTGAPEARGETSRLIVP
jgi:hypothetical protein